MKLSSDDREYIVEVMTEGLGNDWDDRQERFRIKNEVPDHDLYNEFKDLFPELLENLEFKE